MIPLASMGDEVTATQQPSAGEFSVEKQSARKKSKQKKATPTKPPEEVPATPPAEELPPASPAEELPPSPISEEPLGGIIGVADEPRDYLAENFVSMVRDIDRFFGDDRNYQESNDSVLQLDITRVMGYGGEHKFVLSGRAKVHLPNTEKRLHLLIETDPDKNTGIESTRNQPVQPGAKTTPGSYAAGVRYEKTKEDRWYYGADGGLKFQGLAGDPTPFVRGRVSYAMPLEEWRMKVAETVFWFNTIGVGETTQLDFEHPISDPLLFRATSTATWLHDKQNMDIRQDMSFFHTLDDRNALLYQVSAIGVSRPQTQATDYVVLLLYRYRLHRKWMYFEVGPQVHFPRERDFRSSGLLGFRLEILFDESK
jgi:hypothetical protein